MDEEKTPEPQVTPTEEAPKKSNTKKIVIIVVAVLLLLCCIVGAVVGIGAYFGYKGVVAPVDPIKKQLEALNKGNKEDAYYKYTSKEFKRQTSFEQFKEIVNSNPQIFKSKSSSFDQVNIKNGDALVEGKITGKDSTVSKMAYKVVKEDGKWLVYGFQETK